MSQLTESNIIINNSDTELNEYKQLSRNSERLDERTGLSKLLGVSNFPSSDSIKAGEHNKSSLLTELNEGWNSILAKCSRDLWSIWLTSVRHICVLVPGGWTDKLARFCFVSDGKRLL